MAQVYLQASANKDKRALLIYQPLAEFFVQRPAASSGDHQRAKSECSNPQSNTSNTRCREFDTLCFCWRWSKFTCRHLPIKTKERCDLSTPCDVILFRPRGERRGKALSGASISERSSQSPYPLQNEARRCRRNSTSFVFDNMPTNLFVGHSGKNKGSPANASLQVGCKTVFAPHSKQPHEM